MEVSGASYRYCRLLSARADTIIDASSALVLVDFDGDDHEKEVDGDDVNAGVWLPRRHKVQTTIHLSTAYGFLDRVPTALIGGSVTPHGAADLGTVIDRRLGHDVDGMDEDGAVNGVSVDAHCTDVKPWNRRHHS